MKQRAGKRDVAWSAITLIQFCLVFELVVDVSDCPILLLEGKGGYSIPLAPGGMSGTEKMLCKYLFCE